MNTNHIDTLRFPLGNIVSTPLTRPYPYLDLTARRVVRRGPTERQHPFASIDTNIPIITACPPRDLSRGRAPHPERGVRRPVRRILRPECVV